MSIAKNTDTKLGKTLTIGDRVIIIKMEGEPHYTGRTGVVKSIDDAGKVHGTWGGCAIIPDLDEYEIVK